MLNYKLLTSHLTHTVHHSAELTENSFHTFANSLPGHILPSIVDDFYYYFLSSFFAMRSDIHPSNPTDAAAFGQRLSPLDTS